MYHIFDLISKLKSKDCIRHIPQSCFIGFDTFPNFTSENLLLSQEDFDRHRPNYYKGTDVVLVVVEPTVPESFVNLRDKWLPEISRFTKNVPQIVVGTKSDLRNDQTVLYNLKKTKEMPLEHDDIEALCKRHNLEYFETSAKTGDGVEACLFAAAAAGMAFKYKNTKLAVALKMHAVFPFGIDRHILRPFVVDKIFPAIKKDWVTFGVYIGYDKNTLKLAKDRRVNNPFWQILRNWTETIEYLIVDHLKILYRALSKVNKSLQRDLLELVVHDTKSCNIEDEIPLIIWKMGKEAENQYKEVLKSGVEKRYVIRLPVVGPFGAGKTCLTRRLLRKDISDVSSTNGIEIMTQKCKVCLTDATWIFSNDIRFDANQGRKSRLIKNLLTPPITRNKTAARTIKPEKDDKDAITNLDDTRDEITKLFSDQEVTEDKKRKHNLPMHIKTNYETTEETKYQPQVNVLAPAGVTEADLFADLRGWSESEAPLDDFAEVALLDFAGQYEFYATHQTFLNKHAIYLLVLDVSKNIKGLMTSEDIEDNFLDLSEIPFEDIGEYINFWMDAIHCYGDEEPEIDDTKEALPSIIVVGTCCDKLQIDKETRKLEIQEQFDQILGDHPKRKHIKDFIMLSNTTSTESEFDVLRIRIVQLASKVETWGQQFPTRWIKYEEVSDQQRNKQHRVMAYKEMKTLGRSVGLEIKDRNEINLFLRYQHDIGNLIYFDDIPDLVILQPQWLVNVLRCLVSARKFQIKRNIVNNSDWKELEKQGN